MSFARELENLVEKSVFRRLWSVSENEMSTATLTLAEQSRAENALIAQGLRRHDAELLDRLIIQYQHRLLRYLLFLTGNRDLAEDLFQETWMRVLTRGTQYNGAARFDTWLFTIARNLMIDMRRKRTMASLEEMCEVDGEDRAYESPQRRADALRSLSEPRKRPAGHRRSADPRSVAPRSPGAALPRRAFSRRNRAGDARPAFDRQVAPLSRTRRAQTTRCRSRRPAGGR